MRCSAARRSPCQHHGHDFRMAGRARHGGSGKGTAAFGGGGIAIICAKPPCITPVPHGLAHQRRKQYANPMELAVINSLSTLARRAALATNLPGSANLPDVRSCGWMFGGLAAGGECSSTGCKVLAIGWCCGRDRGTNFSVTSTARNADAGFRRYGRYCRVSVNVRSVT